MSEAPLPPVTLAARVGVGGSADPLEGYEREGAGVRARIEAALPADWTWAGRQVLDFGCGSARVLRHFLPEAGQADFWGCDIDAGSVEWIRSNLSPPLHVFRNELAPPLELAAETFDLVYATSVFTHIDALWSRWLLELHRILKPDGLLVSSWVGEGFWEAYNAEPYAEDEVGMVVRNHWTGPDAVVLHSEWWLREHWGRAFEVLDVARPPRSPAGTPEITHSYITLRKRPGTFTPADLEWRDPAEPRELAALDTQVRLLRRESEDLAAAVQGPGLVPAAKAALLSSPAGPTARRMARALRQRG
jgi:SAM-dependent methyltransferase